MLKIGSKHLICRQLEEPDGLYDFLKTETKVDDFQQGGKQESANHQSRFYWEEDTIQKDNSEWI